MDAAVPESIRDCSYLGFFFGFFLAADSSVFYARCHWFSYTKVFRRKPLDLDTGKETDIEGKDASGFCCLGGGDEEE